MSAHWGAENVGYTLEGKYQTLYPPQPNFSPRCVNNLDYDTLPVCAPMRKTLLGPTSVKHLYYGPQYYPSQAMLVPKDTLYGSDTSVYEPNGKLRTYGKKIYPFHHRSPREVIRQSTQVLPLPAIQEWTVYQTLKDGAWGR